MSSNKDKILKGLDQDIKRHDYESDFNEVGKYIKLRNEQHIKHKVKPGITFFKTNEPEEGTP
jgi:hypothetical protein